MNNIELVGIHLEELIQKGAGKEQIIREIGKMCVGWPYVFGAWGEQCTPAGRKRRKRSDHPTIVTACQVLSDEKTTCDGCKWGIGVRMYDCRGFVHWLLEQAGINIQGQGATSQWNTNANWTEKSKIADMPKDKICCVFTGTADRKEHVGIYLGDGSTVECSAGVQYFEKMKSKWKYYAIPAGLYDGQTVPTIPEPTTNTGKPTLKKGSTGIYVTLMQTELIQKGYTCGSKGADGIFGKDTQASLIQFQQDHGLQPDGVCGPDTWDVLDHEPEIQIYTVHIPALPLYKAEALISQYSGAWMTKEGVD